ncbi:ABC transporter substrate-binding protein [Sphingobium sp. HBC34]|uniref:ABC transporter substrate-binding protein n=1 Tax=Sphingobium cyanobacteriorum TaxID=3063954 RepID=A0ABT8ZME0_9SPHN|nr:ABC transporter substrate-binding protein [Sphingobium sp. HBC34]MDO7835636.1 ABC transporter substrate-binding protein [Sphingobium sp. HBC34]
MALSPSHRGKIRLLLVGLMLTLGGCGAGGGDAQQTVLRIGDQVHGLETLLKATGEDRPTGYRIEWSNFLGGPAVIAAQTGGSVDVGWMYETPLVFAQAAGSPVKVVAAARPVTPGASSVALVVRPDSSIRSVRDLRGRKVGLMPGTVTQYLVVRLLEREGLSLSDIRPVTLGSVSPAMLDNGTIDAAVTVDPYLSQMLLSGKARVLASGGAPLTPDLQYVVASDKALADPARAKAIGDLIARIGRALRARQADPDKAVPVYTKALNLPAPVIGQYLRRAPARLAPIDKAVVADQQVLGDTFLKIGLIRKPNDAARLFDHRYDALVREQENIPS